MRGIPFWNFDSFDDASEWLRRNGYNVISPAEHDREVDPDCVLDPNYLTGGETPGAFEKLLGWDFAQIAGPECDGIVLLPGWEKSTGAAHELYVCRALGKPVYEYHTGIALDGGEHWLAELDEDVQLKRQNAAKVEKINEHVEAHNSYVQAEANRQSITEAMTPAVRVFETGASRNGADHKHDYEGFLSIIALRAYGRYMHGHRHLANGELRDSDNWQHGIPTDVYVKSLLRHTFDVWEIHRTGVDAIVDFDDNLTDLEHSLCGVIFNAFGLLHETLQAGKVEG